MGKNQWGTKFPLIMWHYTRAGENLFHLSQDEYWWYQKFVNEVEK